MRETLDVEGVCFIDIDGIDWKHALSPPEYGDNDKTNTSGSGHNRGELGVSSSILSYSHSEWFGAIQRESWPPISQWDEEAEISYPQILGEREEVRYVTRRTQHTDPKFPSQTSQFDDSSDVSAQFNYGRLSNQFLAKFISEHPFGEIFNEGLPDKLRHFLPPGVTSAILTPIYDFEQHPFAMTCAYTTSKHRWFSEAETQYLEVECLQFKLISGIWISDTFSSIEETYYYGRPCEGNIYFKYFTRIKVPSPWHSSFSRIHFRYQIRCPPTHVYRHHRFLWSYTP
jgi:hypothetical protein